MPLDLSCLVDEPCWHVSAGGSTWPTFALALGEKVRRRTPLKNPAQPESYRLCHGSAELLVWCTWRLRPSSDVLVSSQSEESTGRPVLEALVDATLASASCIGPAWDLCLTFSTGVTLEVFADRAASDTVSLPNWELWCGRTAITAGPGVRLEEEPWDGTL